MNCILFHKWSKWKPISKIGHVGIMAKICSKCYKVKIGSGDAELGSLQTLVNEQVTLASTK